MVSAPEKPGVAVPDAARLAAVVKGAGAKEITAYVDTVANAVLLDKVPEPGKITKTTDKAPESLASASCLLGKYPGSPGEKREKHELTA